MTDERLRRTWAASEAQILGHGGLKVLSDITGLTDATISKGIKEISNPKALDFTRIRVPGGGRKTVEDVYPGVTGALIKVLEESTSGSPMSLLKWTTMGLKELEGVLHKKGFPISHVTIMKCFRRPNLSANSRSKMSLNSR